MHYLTIVFVIALYCAHIAEEYYCAHIAEGLDQVWKWLAQGHPGESVAEKRFKPGKSPPTTQSHTILDTSTHTKFNGTVMKWLIVVLSV